MKKIAIIGAQGMVGGKILELLTDKFKMPGIQLVLFEHVSQAGKKIKAGGQTYTLLELNEKNLHATRPDFALFAAGGDISAKFAPIIAGMGGIVIDNSSHFRMHKDVPLIVPEVNPEHLGNIKMGAGRIIANPNCSTIQALVSLKPLDESFGLKRINYATYQAVSGAGKPGLRDLELGKAGQTHQNFAHPIFNNLIPQIDVFLDNGYTKEEMKMIEETKKILGKPGLDVTCTAVRVPVSNCHSIAIEAQFEKPVCAVEAKEILATAKGVKLVDQPSQNNYPMPIMADQQDEVFVGRIRVHPTDPNTLAFFCVADNVRKGAATNAVQILELIVL